MNTIYELIESGGGLAGQFTTPEMCEREAGWLGLERFTIRTLKRAPSWGFDIGAPMRFVRPWPQSKLDELRRRYLRGDGLLRMGFYFDTSISSISNKARRLGLPHRATWKERWGSHGGAWLPEEKRAVRTLHVKHRLSPEQISQDVPRTRDAIAVFLRKTGHLNVDFGTWASRRDRQALVMYHRLGMTPLQIAQETDRVEIEVKFLINRLSYSRELESFGGGWTEREDELIRFMLDEGISINEMAQHIKRSEGAISRRLETVATLRRPKA